jgi:hypothetical protein
MLLGGLLTELDWLIGYRIRFATPDQRGTAQQGAVTGDSLRYPGEPESDTASDIADRRYRKIMKGRSQRDGNSDSAVSANRSAPAAKAALRSPSDRRDAIDAKITAPMTRAVWMSQGSG